MHRVLTKAKVENLTDLYLAKKQKGTRRTVRAIEEADALVQRGEVFLSLPTRLIDQLGLKKVGTRRLRTARGVRLAPVYDPVRLTVHGRAITAEVLGHADQRRVLIGQLLLEALDLVVDQKCHRLIGNPKHRFQWIVDMFYLSSSSAFSASLR